MIGLRGVCAVAWLVLAGNLALHADAQLPALNQRADSYRCPMHPEVSGPPGSQCSRCGMTLVVGSNADYTPYVVDLETVPRALKARESGRLRLWVREPATGSIVRQFDIVHERLFHLFVISGDLDYFAHVHPVLQPDGELDVPIELPRAGPYQLIGDFLPVGGRPQLVQRPLVTAGYRGPLAIVPALAPDLSVKVSEATRVELTPPDPRAGREQLLTFELSDAASGVPADDLQPYLGATGHLFVASADLSVVFHSHPVLRVSSVSGPTVVFQLLFPRPGTYRLWAQFHRRGRVLTAPFTIAIVAP